MSKDHDSHATTTGSTVSGSASGTSEHPWHNIPSSGQIEAVEKPNHHAQRLWGDFLMAGTLSLLVGEASAGKTVFTYRLARALALGEEFLGLTPPMPLRVLHLDLESPESAQAENLKTIGPADTWDFV